MALVAVRAEPSFPQISSIDPAGTGTGFGGGYDDAASTSGLGSTSIGGGGVGGGAVGVGGSGEVSDASRSRLPALKKRRPKMKVVLQLELKELRGEVGDLQAELNTLVGESKQKQLRLRAMVEGDRSENLSAPPAQIGTPAYLQQQLWLVEQATAAENKYESSLRSLLNKSIGDERAQEREKLLIDGELKATVRELRLARDRGTKIGRLNAKSRAQLNHLQQQSALSEQQRDAQLGELGAVRSTVLEQQLRMQERRKRREMFAAEAAGDMDEEGEAELLEQLEQSKLQQSISRTEALQAAAKERALRDEWMRITEVSGEEEEAMIVQRFESQRDNVAQLQLKKVAVEEKLKLLHEDLLAHIDERQRLWQERGTGPSSNMMEQIAVYQEQMRQQGMDAERRSKKVMKIEQILYESKDKMWTICARLAQVPALAHVVGRGITQSDTESNLVNIRTMLPELDRYLPVLMRLFISVVPADARHSDPELLPPWSSPVKRPIISIVESYARPARGDTNARVDDPTVTGNARAMSPDDVQREDEEEGNSELGTPSEMAEHVDVEKLRREAGIEPGSRDRQQAGAKGNKASRRDSKGRGGGRGSRARGRGRGRGGRGRGQRPRTLSPI